MKTCNKCSMEKSLLEFKNDPRNKDGKQGICTDCVRKKEAERRMLRKANPLSCINKICNRCQIEKSTELFFKDSGISDGYSTICKECRNITMNKWRDDNRNKYNANMRKMRAEQKERFKDIDLKRTYGIDLNKYKAMLVEQGNTCKICKKLPQGKRPLVVDHDHSTGEIRGLLCYGCNRAIAILDNRELLRCAKEYLASSQNKV